MKSTGKPPVPEAAPWLEEIDHTGDAAFRLSAPTLTELFERGAIALFGYLTDLGDVKQGETTRLVLEANDLEGLFVRWLAELNYLHHRDRRLFSAFDVELEGETHLRAVARGEFFDAERHTIYTEVKAITYHGLTIEQEDGGWAATIVLDL